MRAAILVAAMAFGLAESAAAQEFSFRPFLMFAEQQFAATDTFEAVFGQANQSFWGGGLNVIQDDKFYLEVSASRFEKTGQRAFVNNGKAFQLNIPLTATMTPLEFSAGYRFNAGKPVLPYLGAGIGAYRYKETSEFSSGEENIDTTHAGFIAEGGVEFRLHRWVGVAVDGHYTYIPGILGDSGISKDVGEKSLGGISGRFKIIVGK